MYAPKPSKATLLDCSLNLEVVAVVVIRVPLAVGLHYLDHQQLALWDRLAVNLAEVAAIGFIKPAGRHCLRQLNVFLTSHCALPF